jgi:hypothetical protein
VATASFDPSLQTHYQSIERASLDDHARITFLVYESDGGERLGSGDLPRLHEQPGRLQAPAPIRDGSAARRRPVCGLLGECPRFERVGSHSVRVGRALPIRWRGRPPRTPASGLVRSGAAPFPALGRLHRDLRFRPVRQRDLERRPPPGDGTLRELRRTLALRQRAALRRLSACVHARHRQLGAGGDELDRDGRLDRCG